MRKSCFHTFWCSNCFSWYCCYHCCRCCCCRNKKPECPKKSTDCEGSECQELRNFVASQGYDASTNIAYNYTQINRTFQQAVQYCQGIGYPFRLATLEELTLLSHLFIYVDEGGKEQPCPTLVWSTENGNPVIVRITPCSGDSIEIIRKFDINKCMVETLSVAPTGT